MEPILVDEDNTVDYLRQLALTKKKNLILFMDDRYAVGVDLKFENGAYVICYSPGAPSKEIVMQCFARGSRDGGVLQGLLAIRV